MDVSRTVGWFTSLSPVLLEPASDPGEGESLKAVKEQLRAVPNRGIGYGLLRYLGPEPLRAGMAEDGPAQLLFEYLGQFDRSIPADADFTLATEMPGPEPDPRARRTHLLVVSGGVLGGRLQMEWSYGAHLHREATIEGLAGRYLAELRSLVAHCRTAGAGGGTPSDFPAAPAHPGRAGPAAGAGGGGRMCTCSLPCSRGCSSTPCTSRRAKRTSCSSTSSCGSPAGGRAPLAWQGVVDRHAALRTAFAWQDLAGRTQVVTERAQAPWAGEDWSALDAEEQEARLAGFLAADRAQGFDLEKAPLVRFALFRIAEDRHRFVWSQHHLLLDGWSISRVLGEVFAIYQARSRGEEPRLGRVRPYRDYIGWLGRQDLAAAESFWRGVLRGFTSPTPMHLERPAETGEAGYAEVRRELPGPATDALHETARRHGLTLSTLVHGAWALLLSRYSGEDDVVFGATVSGRPPELPGVEEMVGLFINTLPVRVRVQPDAERLPWLQVLQAAQGEARQHGYAPLADIQRWSEVGSGTPLFDSLLAFENYPVDDALRAGSSGLHAAAVRAEERTTYGVSLAVAPGATLRIRAGFQRSRFAAAAVERLLDHLCDVLEAMATSPARRLSEIVPLTAWDRERVLVEWNRTGAEYPSACVHELFAGQAARTPGAPSVVCGAEALTYAELDARSARLANHLRGLGVGPEVRVGVCLDRSAELVVAVLGVLRAGGAYVPLDPAYPPERLRFLVADAGVSVLLSQERHAQRFPGFAGATVRLDTHRSAVASEPATPPPPGAGPRNLAYVLYTSGSTGTPKGVGVEHGGLSNYLAYFDREVLGRPGFRLPLVSRLSFDAHVRQLFPPLLRGEAVWILPEDVVANPAGMVEALATGERVSFGGVPSLWSALLELIETGDVPAPPGLRAVLLGGEALPADLVERTFAAFPEVVIWNHYGPTEATVNTTVARLRPGTGVTLGRPVANARLYVLDRAGLPLPVGVPGGALRRGGGAVARLRRAAGAHRGALRPRSLRPCARGAAVPDGGPRALAPRWEAGVRRAGGRAGKGAGHPHRAGGDRGRAPDAPRGARGGGGGARGCPGAEAARGVRGRAGRRPGGGAA